MIIKSAACIRLMIEKDDQRIYDYSTVSSPEIIVHDLAWEGLISLHYNLYLTTANI